MTKRDIFSVALKILGIISIMHVIESIFAIGMGFTIMFGKPGQVSGVDNPNLLLVTGIISLVLWLAMAYSLLRWGDFFARKMIHDDSMISLSDKNQWEKPVFILSLRIIGVVCLAIGIPRLMDLLFDFGISVIRHRPESTIHVTSIALVILGFYLISGGRHLVEFVYRGNDNGKE